MSLANRFEARVPLWRFLLQLLRVLGVAALGFLFLYAGASGRGGLARPAFGVFLILLALFGLAAALASRPARRASLILDSEGLDHALSGKVRWSDVLGLELQTLTNRYSSVPVLILGLEPHANVRNRAGWLPSVSGKDRLTVVLKGLDHQPERILAAARALRDQVDPPSLPGWYVSMSPELLRASRKQRQLMSEHDRLASNPSRPRGTGAALDHLEQQLKDNSRVLDRASAARLHGNRILSRWLLSGAALLTILMLCLAWFRYPSH